MNPTRDPAARARGVIDSTSTGAGFPLAVWQQAAALVLLVILAYLPAWRAGFIWDDDAFLTTNALIQEPGGLARFWFSTDAPDYFPLTSTTLWFEWRLWGLNPLGYHLTNILLHAASVVVCWRVLARLRVPGAWLGAAIFALHPVNVESVAWITERKNVLTMFFYALTLWWFLKAEAEKKRGWYSASIVAFLMALLSKTSVTPLPLVLLGLAWWQRGKISARDWGRALPFFVLAIGLGCVTVWFQAHRAIGEEVIRTDSLASRLAVAGCAVWFYLGKALLPVQLSFVYPRWEIQPAQLLWYVPLLLWIGGLGLCWWRRGQWGRTWLFVFGYYGLLLAPILGFVNIYFMRYSFVADHWQYFALPAITALVAAGLVRLPVAMRWPSAILVLGALGTLTWLQAGQYRNQETLWRATLARNPKAYVAHLNLGAILLERAEDEAPAPAVKQAMVNQAVTHFEEAVRLQPQDGVAECNLGAALANRGDLSAALDHTRRALELSPKSARARVALANLLIARGERTNAIPYLQEAVRLEPRWGEAHYVLGKALFNQGQLDAALPELHAALNSRRGLVEIHNLLGQVLQLKGRLNEAIPHFQRALALQPRHAGAHNNLAGLLLQLGQVQPAVDHFKAALENQPNLAEAHYNLGNIAMQQGNAEVAIDYFRQAIKFQPDNAAAQNNLAGLLLKNGNVTEAVTHFERALELRPQHAVTHNNLGRALLQAGKPEAAAGHFREALTLQPDLATASENLRQTAWLLITSPDDTVRNGKRAIELTHEVERYVGTNHPAVLGTLAAAYAEAGRFGEAITTAERAVQLATIRTNLGLAKDLDVQISLYRSNVTLHGASKLPSR